MKDTAQPVEFPPSKNGWALKSNPRTAKKKCNIDPGKGYIKIFILTMDS
jgi:hypothetical protein